MLENKSSLFIGFKGKRNSSGLLVNEFSKKPCLLTNSFSGVQKDIESIDGTYDYVIMFGCNKSLKDFVRIERFAEKGGVKNETSLDIKLLSEVLTRDGIANAISEVPTYYLCNEAYWYALQKFEKKVVFIHIPTLKNIDNIFVAKMKACFKNWE